jgi:hypothetical protein
MTIQTFKPAKYLNSFIESYIIIQTDEAITKAIIPQTSFILKFRSKGHRYKTENTHKDFHQLQ